MHTKSMRLNLPHLSAGTNEIIVDVDDDGVISLIFECSEMGEGSEFIWSKNYTELKDTSRLTIESSGGRWVSVFCFFFHFCNWLFLDM